MPQRSAKKPIGRRLLLEQLEPRRPLAVDFQLVADLVPGFRETSTFPTDFVECNGLVYFRATGESGLKLWRTDGTVAGTVQVLDLHPSRGVLNEPIESYLPRLNMANVNGTLYFPANDGSSGFELWKTDGTPQGTSLVKDIRPGVNGSALRDLVNVDGRLFFRADNGVTGLEMWTSDGTEAGTLLLKDANNSPSGSQGQSLTSFNGALYFSASTNGGRALFKSDGTVAGTVPVTFSGGPFAIDVASGNVLTAAGNQLFFITALGALWKTDGTTAGTVEIKADANFAFVDRLVEMNGEVYFCVPSGASAGLWKSDGSTAGTVRVASANLPNYPRIPTELLNVAGVLYFTNIESLWRSDGTAAGTTWVASGHSLTNVDGTLYFVAEQDGAGEELWKTDGTPAGTVRVVDLFPGSQGSAPAELFNYNGRLLFSGRKSSFDNELWITDGSAAGTTQLTAGQAPLSSNPQFSVNVNGVLLFAAKPSDPGAYFLWRSDGTAAGTRQVDGLNLGPNTRFFTTAFIPLGDQVYFFASDASHQSGIWKSDGNVASIVYNFNSGPLAANRTNLVVAGDQLYLIGRSTNDKASLWRIDEQQATAELIAELPGLIGDYSAFGSMVSVGSRLYFTATHTGVGTELWTSDGTAAGTLKITNSAAHLTNVGGTLFFTSTDAATGNELWKSNGTLAGTVRVKDIRPGAYGSGPTQLTAHGNRLFFSASDGVSGFELWTSDGTPVGTVRVLDVTPGSAGSGFANFTPVGGLLYFTGRTTSLGGELWRTDGTAAGTFLVKDLFPGGASGQVQSLVVIDEELYFTAQDGVHGAELWKTDGTIAGTVLVADVAAGFFSSFPEFITKVGGKLFIAATTPQHGRELWFAQIDPLPTGDYTGDDRVDGADFLAWQRAFGAIAAPAGSGADGDASGHVDADDLVVWQEHFGTPAVDAAAASAAFASLAAIETDEEASDNQPSTVTRVPTPDWFLTDGMFAQPTVAPTLPSALLREQRALRLATKSARGENNETPLAPRAQSFRLSKNISPAAHDAESDATEEGFDAETLQAGSLRRVRGQQRS